MIGDSVARRAALLEEASALLVEGGRESELFARLAALPVPRVALWCTIELLRDRGWHTVGQAQADPGAEAGTHSVAALPLVAQGRSLGLMSFGFPAVRTEADDRQLAIELARFAAVAAERSELQRRADLACRPQSDFVLTLAAELSAPLSTLVLAAKQLSGMDLPESRAAEAERLAQLIGRQARRLVLAMGEFLAVPRPVRG
jgi:GAF domain-containing protein